MVIPYTITGIFIVAKWSFKIHKKAVRKIKKGKLAKAIFFDFVLFKKLAKILIYKKCAIKKEAKPNTKNCSLKSNKTSPQKEKNKADTNQKFGFFTETKYRITKEVIKSGLLIKATNSLAKIP